MTATVVTGLTADVRAVLQLTGLPESPATPAGGFTVEPMTAIGPERAVIHVTPPDLLGTCERAVRAAGYRTVRLRDADGFCLAVMRTRATT